MKRLALLLALVVFSAGVVVEAQAEAAPAHARHVHRARVARHRKGRARHHSRRKAHHRPARKHRGAAGHKRRRR